MFPNVSCEVLMVNDPYEVEMLCTFKPLEPDAVISSTGFAQNYSIGINALYAYVFFEKLAS